MKNSGCCYGYVRVSTAVQALEGSSLEEQEKKIRAWATLQDMKLMGVYVDAGVSGTFMFERPEFSRLMRDIDRGDVLVANDVSRVSRNPGDMSILLDKLTKIGASAVFIKDGFDTSTGVGKIMAQMLTLMKAAEASYTSERTKEASLAAKQTGRATGRPPYGWKRKEDQKGSSLIEVPEQQEIIKLIRKYHDEDGMTFYAIANRLTSDEVPTPSGRKVWKNTVVTKIYERKNVATKGRHDL